jgi:hypothetical protein
MVLQEHATIEGSFKGIKIGNNKEKNRRGNPDKSFQGSVIATGEWYQGRFLGRNSSK